MGSKYVVLFVQKCMDYWVIFVEPVLAVPGGRNEDFEGSSGLCP